MPKSQPSPSILTLEDLVHLLDHVSDLESGLGRRFLEFVRTDPRLGQLYQELLAMAADAGVTEPNGFVGALDAHRMVDRLEAADGRLGPEKVLAESFDDWDLYLDYMIRVVEARTTRAADPGRLLGIRRKLEIASRQFKERYCGS